MKILLTGATGFLGRAIALKHSTEGLITLGRNNCNITTHLEKDTPVLPIVDLVIHAAGKAHSVPKDKAQEKEFYDVNVQGTVSLLKGLEATGKIPKSFVFISSIAVYGVTEGHLLNEETPLFAKDAYGRSKVEAEQLIRNWCDKHQVKCTILRLPLIAGYNPPGNLKAMINGMKMGYYFNIDGGKAKKSMVMADDVAAIILPASEKGGIYNLTDGYHPSFMELSVIISKQLNKSKPLNIPLWLAKIMAVIGDLIGSKAPINSNKLAKITKDLTFADQKAKELIGWNPKSVIAEFKI